MNVPVLMNAKQLEAFYYLLMEKQEEEDTEHQETFEGGI